MPLDEFQRAVLRVLMPLRSPNSVFAGGSVLQRHGFRLSDDQGIFHGAGENIEEISRRDADALELAGFAVDRRIPFEGMADAQIAKAGEGSTRLQRVESGSWNFFAPVPDPDFGWRLHMADLAVNKALAAGGRRQARDYVDLFLIHRHIMPLWHAIWAAPGKDEAWSPCSLVEKIAMTNNFPQAEIDEDIVSTIELSAAEIGLTVRAAIDQAREVFEILPDAAAGKLFVNADGAVCSDVDLILSDTASVKAIDPVRGGTWPSGPDIDHALIETVVEAFGWEGRAAAARDPAERLAP